MEKPTYITLLLDKSQSMEVTKKSTIDGFNKFLSSQKEDGLNKIVSLYQFNQRRYTTFENLDLKKVENLNYDAFIPEGSTALNDAIGFTIERTNHITKNKDYNIIFVILTDGEENSSRNYDSHDIEKSILKMKERDWNFIFIGANQDAILSGAKYGIDVNSSLTFSQSDGGTANCFDSLSCAVNRQINSDGGAISFTSEEREASQSNSYAALN